MITPFLAYDQAMRCLATLTLLILVMAQPVAAQTFKPDVDAGEDAWGQKDYATAVRPLGSLAEQGGVLMQCPEYSTSAAGEGGWFPVPASTGRW